VRLGAPQLLQRRLAARVAARVFQKPAGAPIAKKGWTADRAEWLLMRRVGQLQMLKQIIAGTGPVREGIRKQLKHKLRSDCECEQFPAIQDNLHDPLWPVSCAIRAK
jgi:hypothetical protein